jgi:cytochrome P450
MTASPTNLAGVTSTLTHMDDSAPRGATGGDRFRHAMLAKAGDELATRYVDHMAAVGPECDFVQEVAVNFPLYVIMSLLGVPESDFPRMLQYTQELFGNDDAEFSAGASKEDQLAVLLDMFGYFTALTAARREHPTEDLASAIANARVDGEPLSDVDTVSYYVIIATAGHDTTSATISGGLHALIEHPDQLQRLRDDPQLMGLAGEEMIRWVTPVKEFMRTAVADTMIRGCRSRRGVGAAVLSVRQPRRGRVHRPVSLRRWPRPEQARGLRLRRALLPRRGAGSD